MLPRTLSVVLLLAATAVPAQGNKIFKWQLPDGSITYSDRPPVEGAKQVDLPPLQTYTPPPAPASSAATGAAAGKTARKYDVVRIVAPKADETIRDNSGTVSVRIELKPPLQPGHTVEILLDGKAIGSGAATSASVSDVDRGSHTLSAQVKDETGATVASAPAVTFHLKQASKLQGGGPPASNPPPKPVHPIVPPPAPTPRS